MKNKDKKEVENAETTEKPSGTKAKKNKKDKQEYKDTTFLKIIIILSIAAVAALSLSGGANFWLAQQTIISADETNRASNLENYTHLVNANIKSLSKDIINISKIIANDPAVFELDSVAMAKIDSLIANNFPGSIGSKLFIHGQYNLDKESYPPVNFATQKQLLAAETDDQVLPEYYASPKGSYFSVAAAIRNPDTNELVYTLLTSYPESILTDNIPTQAIENTQISLVQTFDQGGNQTIFKVGTPVTGDNKHTTKTIQPNWKIVFHSSQKQKQFTDTAKSLAASLGLSFLIIFGAIIFSIKSLQKSLAADAGLILEFVRSAKQKSISKSMFSTGVFRNLYSQLKKLDVKSSNKKSKKKSANDSQTDFDIDMSSDDENLFGGEHVVSTERNQVEPTSDTAEDVTPINPSIFRAYDIRGIVGETLDPSSVKLIGQAIGSQALKQGENTLAIARDGRLSGSELSQALSDGIRASGANVIDLGMVPTPVLYFACKTLDTRSGVMLTGSHNPSNHNGLKMVINGTTLSQDAIQQLRTDIEAGDLSEGEGELTSEDILPAYLDAIENDVILAQPLDVVIDCGNGVAGVIAEKLFTEIGCNVTPLFTEVDGNFPNHHPDPSQPKNLEALITKVKETGAHLGVAFDGDGDRVGLVTNTGKIIWPDRLMMLFAKDILTRSPGADIIFDVKCSNTLADTIRKQGGRPLMWKTGHSLIKAKLKESGAQLAGEMSGHIFFNDRWYGFDDGLYSAARLMEILSTDAKTCDEIFAEFPEMVSTPEINIAVDDESKFDLISILASHGDFGEGSKNDIDGIRVDYTDGWGLVRASNTTANIVTRFEAKSDERLEEIKALFKTQILKVQNDLDVPF